MSGADLAVYLHGTKIGFLARTKNGARFCYEEAFAARHGGSPFLSTALPVQMDPFDAAATMAWFSGLLPEDDRLDAVRRFYGIEGLGYLDVLEEIGWECAGAVAVVPEPDAPAPDDTGGVETITLAELAQRLKALPDHPYDTTETMRLSLGGFQEKLGIVAPDARRQHDGTFALPTIGVPLGGTPTTHILKPQPSRFPGLVEGEAWAMTAADSATPAAVVGLLDARGTDAPQTLVVERFDRIRDENGRLRRIHQEDCCQALGLMPERKYAAESSPKKSDPSLRSIAGLLSRYAVDVHGELATLLRQLTVNVALGNTDAHAKNYAFLHFGDGITLAPMYDVVPALQITPNVLAMGMRVAGRIRIDRIGREELLKEAVSWGLSRKACAQVLDDTLERIATGIERADALYPRAGERHAGPTRERLGRLARKK